MERKYRIEKGRRKMRVCFLRLLALLERSRGLVSIHSAANNCNHKISHLIIIVSQ
jgi:hypothetical protein